MSCITSLRLSVIPPSKGPGYLAPVLGGGHGRSCLESNCFLHQLPWQFSQHPPNPPQFQILPMEPGGYNYSKESLEILTQLEDRVNCLLSAPFIKPP